MSHRVGDDLTIGIEQTEQTILTQEISDDAHRVILVPRSLNSGFPLLGAERTSLLWSLTGG
jgi:hypothetical protein